MQCVVERNARDGVLADTGGSTRRGLSVVGAGVIRSAPAVQPCDPAVIRHVHAGDRHVDIRVVRRIARCLDLVCSDFEYPDLRADKQAVRHFRRHRVVGVRRLVRPIEMGGEGVGALDGQHNIERGFPKPGGHNGVGIEGEGIFTAPGLFIVKPCRIVALP